MTTELILNVLVAIYFLLLPFWFVKWLSFLQIHPPYSREVLLSLVVLVLASLIWPIAIPIAYLELLSKYSSR